MKNEARRRPRALHMDVSPGVPDGPTGATSSSATVSQQWQTPAVSAGWVKLEHPTVIDTATFKSGGTVARTAGSRPPPGWVRPQPRATPPPTAPLQLLPLLGWHSTKCRNYA
jgi:hypothetical protein